MPIYEYQCQTCECCFEKLVFAGDTETPECPKCCKRDVRRLMSAAAFIGRPGDKGCSPAGAGTGFS